MKRFPVCAALLCTGGGALAQHVAADQKLTYFEGYS